MAEESRAAPYAPPATVLHVIRHYRQREVPERLSDTLLQQLGVTESLLRIVRQALVFLGLIGEDGLTTQNFRALRFASDDEYSKVFREILTAAYAEILAIHNPETATRSQLLNAFRPYRPASVHNRMITLFLALCQEAGMEIVEPPKQSSTRSSGRPSSRARDSAASTKTGRNAEQNRSPATPRAIDPPTKGVLFGFTEDDVANLSDDEFNEVWSALGKVARARAKSRATPPAEAEAPQGER